ncbi:MAG TPA: S-methyl-5-thioribose-1-phosphate isomerase [Nitrososphaerales archaeon]
MVRSAYEKGKCIQIVASETRPALQGARLTTYELNQDGFHVTLIADTMIGYMMSKKLIDKVIVGADRITRTGHIFNKIGTYQIAILAKKHHLPFYVAAPLSTFDFETDWHDVVIEERNIEEIIKIRGRRIAAKGVNIFNPAFDVTPPDLVTSIVTERGIINSDFRNSISKMN